MPAVVKKQGKGGYNIVDKKTGEVKGHSATKAKAQRSANARNAAHYSNWKPTGKRTGK